MTLKIATLVLGLVIATTGAVSGGAEGAAIVILLQA